MSGPPAVTVPEEAAAAGLAARLEALEDDLAADLDELLAAAVDIERAAEALGEHALCLRARLLQADIWQRRGDTAAAVRVLSEVNAWATEHDHHGLGSRSHRLLGWVHYTLGDIAACLEHNVRAVELLGDDAPPRTRASYLMGLAGALSAIGSFDAARERYEQAERLAVASGDVHRQLAILNNLAYSEFEAGEVHHAWAVVERMEAVAAATGWTITPGHLDTIAQVLIALGRYRDAERAAQASIEGFERSGEHEAQSLAESLLTLALARRHLGATSAAQTSLKRCLSLCDDRDLAEIRVRAEREQAELYAAGGDFRRAFETYKTFHVAHENLVSQRREAQARTRQAMFETREARQEAERFREQACRDPLTGLRNRRYVDEHLTGFLDRARRTGDPLVAALVDLDHFKRINDTCSHDIGDQVLVAVAGLLTAAVMDGSGFAARLGGEEFLLVFTELSVADAVRRLEDFRRAVAGHPWQPLTGDLPVTVSVGVSEAGVDTNQRDLLARADECLYAAKRSGRNRVQVAQRT